MEFKEEFDTSAKETWCELIKDIVAISNTGGGVIIFGLDNRGNAMGSDVSGISATDPATITDKVGKYTGYQFTEFQIIDCEKSGQDLVALLLDPVQVPMVFQRPGTYDVGGGKQKTAFSQGTVYFRHGAKSEPGTSDDIRLAIERCVANVRKEWLSGIKNVINTPSGAVASVSGTDVVETSSTDATPIRITTDPKAPGYRIIDPDTSHPNRQKELIREINKRLGKKVVNQYDIQCVKNVFDLVSKKDFCYTPRFGATQYSDACVNWLVDQYERDIQFFVTTRSKFRAQRK